MKKYKILNLYACLGGNRYKWDEVNDNIEVTAIELDEELAKLYQKRFPNDKVIVADAHQYLLDHYKEFDFIWSSPPCPTHSRVRISQKNRDTLIPMYPDMKLYQEILFLDNYFEGKYCVENVIPFYEPLIPAKKRGRHLYWTNFNLPSDLGERKEGKGLVGSSVKGEVKLLEKFHEIDVSEYKGKQRKDKVCRNLVDFEAGKTILMTVFNIKRQSDVKQGSLFETVL
ncbi:MAG: DNA cytosine methyltransferase [Flavobacteriaceae bacterium]|nr:DNA cytosine methyltransferase [Flavobacteriaceae bacterium]